MLSPEIFRRLFLYPEPAYPLRKAAMLLGVATKRLREVIDTGEIEAADTDKGPALAWSEMVSFALETWSQEVVEATLGADLAQAIPELTRLTTLEVRIPRFQVIALEKVAAREKRSVGDVLARELLDFVSARADWLEREIAGFADAIDWPA